MGIGASSKNFWLAMLSFRPPDLLVNTWFFSLTITNYKRNGNCNSSLKLTAQHRNLIVINNKKLSHNGLWAAHSCNLCDSTKINSTHRVGKCRNLQSGNTMICLSNHFKGSSNEVESNYCMVFRLCRRFPVKISGDRYHWWLFSSGGFEWTGPEPRSIRLGISTGSCHGTRHELCSLG